MAEPKIVKSDEKTFGLYSMYKTILKEILDIPTYNEKTRKIETPKDAKTQIYNAFKNGLEVLGLKAEGKGKDTLAAVNAVAPFAGLEDVIDDPTKTANLLVGSMLMDNSPVASNLAAMDKKDKLAGYAKELGYN